MEMSNLSSLSNETNNILAILMSAAKGSLPLTTIEHYSEMKRNGFEPKVIYDIGSSALHFARVARTLWPKAKIILFEANKDCEFLYKDSPFEYHIGVLSDKDGETKKFWVSDVHFGGDSYYRENHSREHFTNYREMISETLDTIVEQRQFPLPDFIKIDCQGAEKDIIAGGLKCVANAKRMVVECQITNYNEGAPRAEETLAYIATLGFTHADVVSPTGMDADFSLTR